MSGGGELRGWAAIRTVARREIRERGRDKSTAISTLVTLVILAAIVVLPSALGSDKDPKAKVVAAGPASLAVARAAHANQKPFSVRLTVDPTSTDAAAARRVRDGGADVAVLGGGRAVVAAHDAEEGAIAAVQAASRAQRTAAALAARGLSRAEAAQALAPPALPVSRTGKEDASGLAFVVLLVLYGQILAYGIVVATGVVEEKQTRIVELLLSAIRPRDLLAGKVLGVGVVGLVQLLVIGAVGIALSAATGRLDVGGPGVPGALLIALCWFLLGFALYACAYATGGALVSRQEELQTTTTPITMAVVGSFFVSLPALSDPSSTLAEVLSFIPPCAPLVMPIRQIAGDAPAWQIGLSVLVMLAAIALLIAIASRVYANAVLRTGARVRLRAALRTR